MVNQRGQHPIPDLQTPFSPPCWLRKQKRASEFVRRPSRIICPALRPAMDFRLAPAVPPVVPVVPARLPVPPGA